MKKKTSIMLSLATILLSATLGNTATHAACASFFSVGANAETIYACSGVSDSSQIPGFSIDLSNNKITLNNYNGGAIYYFCRGTCDGTMNMEIELIGDNTINSEYSSEYLNEGGMPKNAAFINIIPNFTGSGTLKIDAATPFAFENPNSTSLSLEIVGKDFVSTSTQQTNQTTDTEEDITPLVIGVDDLTEESTSTTETNSLSGNKTSFFDTAAGIALLVSVPSVLVIIIILFIIALARKSKKPQLPEQNNLPTDPGQTI